MVVVPHGPLYGFNLLAAPVNPRSVPLLDLLWPLATHATHGDGAGTGAAFAQRSVKHPELNINPHRLDFLLRGRGYKDVQSLTSKQEGALWIKGSRSANASWKTIRHEST